MCTLHKLPGTAYIASGGAHCITCNSAYTIGKLDKVPVSKSTGCSQIPVPSISSLRSGHTCVFVLVACCLFFKTPWQFSLYLGLGTTELWKLTLQEASQGLWPSLGQHEDILENPLPEQVLGYMRKADEHCTKLSEDLSTVCMTVVHLICCWKNPIV